MFTDYCGRCFDSKQGMSNHIDIHKLYRQMFLCDFPGCEKVLSSSSTLRYHKAAVHEKVHRFECDLCGKKSYHKQSLFYHFRSNHTKVRDVQCEICAKLFTSEDGLKMHLSNQHPSDGEKPKYPCKACGTHFAYKSAVSQHMKTHRDPEFDCSQCGKKFHFKQNLLDHMDHHEILAFPCRQPSCNRSFRTEAKLNHHLKFVHFKEKRTFRCEICLSTFTKRTTCRDHVLRQHKNLEPSIRDELLTRIKTMEPEEKTRTGIIE